MGAGLAGQRNSVGSRSADQDSGPENPGALRVLSKRLRNGARQRCARTRNMIPYPKARNLMNGKTSRGKDSQEIVCVRPPAKSESDGSMSPRLYYALVGSPEGMVDEYFMRQNRGGAISIVFTPPVRHFGISFCPLSHLDLPRNS